jgi:methionyl-tRNA synthetase
MCTIVSGIAESFKPEDIGKSDRISKLGSRNLRGVESQGMILMTTNAEGKLVLLTQILKQQMERL